MSKKIRFILGSLEKSFDDWFLSLDMAAAVNRLSPAEPSQVNNSLMNK